MLTIPQLLKLLLAFGCLFGGCLVLTSNPGLALAAAGYFMSASMVISKAAVFVFRDEEEEP